MKAILFDVDDTLYNQIQPFENAYNELFQESFQFSIEELFKHSRKHSDEVFEASQNGKITMNEMYCYRIRKAFEDFGIMISDAEALEFQDRYAYYAKNITLTKTMKEILDYCSENAIVGIITNGPSQHQWNKIRILGLTKWIEENNIFVSADLGITKPDKKIFDYVVKKMALKEEKYFVGDSLENDVIGATKAGWNSVWFNRRNSNITLSEYIQKYEANTEEQLYSIVKKIL